MNLRKVDWMGFNIRLDTPEEKITELEDSSVQTV